jgi:RHS repeat-associated protein
MVSQTAGWLRVPEEAGSDQSALYLPANKPIRLAFEPITVNADGYIYVWVSNQSKQAKVWFDDLKVALQGSFVTQATDYGVWGDVIREQKSDESVYRYGYQGEFSERDLATGWNHFELREYDLVIGRWLVPDPYGYNWSPYVGMDNNPMVNVDPDGGCPNGNCDDWYNNGEATVLDEVTVTASRSIEVDIETLEYDYAASFDKYQLSFPEFKGMSQLEAIEYWNQKYSQDFYRQWQESVKRERDRENVARLAWLIQGWTTVWPVSLGALGGSNLNIPKTFKYAPRGIVVRPHLNINSKQLGAKFGEHFDASLPGYRSAAEYRALIHKIYNDPNSLYRAIPNNAKVHAGEHLFYNNGNLLRLGPDGSFRSLYPIK